MIAMQVATTVLSELTLSTRIRSQRRDGRLYVLLVVFMLVLPCHGAISHVHSCSQVLPSASSQPPPSPRDRHVSVAYGNSFYIHGGFDGVSRDDGLFAFDFSTMEWRQVFATQGRPPSARHSHAAVVYGHAMYIFG
jgi:Galactose oxidase, central domain